MSFSVAPLAGATAAIVVVGALAAGLLHLLRRRSITTVLIATVLAAIAVLTAGVLASTAAALRGQQLRDLLTSMSIAALVSVVLGIGLAKLIMTASVELRRAVRLLADDEHVRLPDSPTAELRGLAEELAATQHRLGKARERAQAVESNRRELLAWIGHDLRTPLARLRAMAEGLEDGVVRAAEIEPYHRAIRLQVERLSALVDDVLEVATIDAGALAPVVVPIALDDLISDMLAAARPVALAKGVVLTGDAPPGLAVDVDPRLLNRVLDNLLGNALRETPPGGTVDISAGESAGEVWLAVRDTCGGIEADALPRVFDRGFRGEANRPADGRAGLGLAIARGFVNALGGDITVRNTQNGCVFRAVVPMHPRTVAADTIVAVRQAPKSG